MHASQQHAKKFRLLLRQNFESRMIQHALGRRTGDVPVQCPKQKLSHTFVLGRDQVAVLQSTAIHRVRVTWPMLSNIHSTPRSSTQSRTQQMHWRTFLVRALRYTGWGTALKLKTCFQGHDKRTLKKKLSQKSNDTFVLGCDQVVVLQSTAILSLKSVFVLYLCLSYHVPENMFSISKGPKET